MNNTPNKNTVPNGKGKENSHENQTTAPRRTGSSHGGPFGRGGPMAMMKGGATEGATGENAICHMSQQVDLIIGTIAILVADSMMGEVTPKMAQAIAASKAEKLLLPLQKCGLNVVGIKEMSINNMLEELEKEIKSRL